MNKYLSSSLCASILCCINLTAKADFLPLYKSPSDDVLNLTYYYEPGIDGLDDAIEYTAVYRALSVWSQKTSINFTEVDQADDATITILWPEDFLDAGGVIPIEAGFPGGLAVQSGTILTSNTPTGELRFYAQRAHISLDHNDILDEDSLVAITMHEVGHALGLEHTDSIDDIMVGVVNSYQARISSFDFDLAVAHYDYSVNEVALPIGLDFEGDYIWPNRGEVNWTMAWTATASSGTGPVAAAKGRGYAYTETSGSHPFLDGAETAYEQGAEAIIESPLFDATNAVLSFKYNMYGADIGSLSVDVFKNGSWSSIWSKTGAQHGSGSTWSPVTLDLSAHGASVMVRFRSVKNKRGYKGDMAIDDVLIARQSVAYTGGWVERPTWPSAKHSTLSGSGFKLKWDMPLEPSGLDDIVASYIDIVLISSGDNLRVRNLSGDTRSYQFSNIPPGSYDARVTACFIDWDDFERCSRSQAIIELTE